MQDYITGVLERSEPLERFHGVTFSRQLTIRTLVGRTLQIDDTEGIANDLRTGKTYQFVICVSGVQRVRAFTHSNTETSKFSGTIRKMRWEPDLEAYQVYHSELVNDPMSVIGAVFGHVLLSRLLLGGAEAGYAVTWGKDQFSLVAVYK